MNTLTTNPNLTPTTCTDIYIDAKQGSVPTTALIDAGMNLLRMSKDGQRVIIQVHSAKASISIKLTRQGLGNFSEEWDIDSFTTKSQANDFMNPGLDTSE